MRLERAVLADREHDSREPPELDHCPDVLSFGLRVQRVFVGPGHHVDRAGEQRIERLPAALEIAQRYGEAVILEVAAPLRERKRQIIKMRLVGDAQLERGTFNLLRTSRPEGDLAKRQASQAGDQTPAVVLHAAAPFEKIRGKYSHYCVGLASRRSWNSSKMPGNAGGLRSWILGRQKI